MNKRLAMLEAMVASGKADSFAYYGLALEYRKLGQTTAAVSTFERLRERDASYLPMYLMAGQLLLDAGTPLEAAVWLNQGIALAKSRGDMKTLSELEAALAQTAH